MWGWGIESAASVSERTEGLRRSIEPFAFWASILLPAAYVPFLTVGIDSVELAASFAALVAFHCVVLTVGHRYGR